jgi:hypothetical protein
MINNRIVLVLLAVITLAVGLSLISFRLAKSQTASNSQVASSRGNAQDGLQGFAPTSSALAVEGNGRLERLLAAEITRQAEGIALLGRIDLLKVPVDQVGQPLVYVTVQRKDILWTPFYARSTIQVDVAYATDGDVSFRNNDPTHFVSLTDQPYVQYYGSYSFDDKSWGVFSWPGYQDHLADQIAKTVLASLQEELSR